jgi:hypothetical protein
MTDELYCTQFGKRERPGERYEQLFLSLTMLECLIKLSEGSILHKMNLP